MFIVIVKTCMHSHYDGILWEKKNNGEDMMRNYFCLMALKTPQMQTAPITRWEIAFKITNISSVELIMIAYCAGLEYISSSIWI